jgi:hypothetical protein
LWARGSQMVKALSYKPEGRGFETRWDEILNLPNPFGRTRPWGFTQPLAEMSTGNIKKIMFLVSKVPPVFGADNLTAIYERVDCLHNVGSLTSHNIISFHGLLQE